LGLQGFGVQRSWVQGLGRKGWVKGFGQGHGWSPERSVFRVVVYRSSSLERRCDGGALITVRSGARIVAASCSAPLCSAPHLSAGRCKGGDKAASQRAVRSLCARSLAVALRTAKHVITRASCSAAAAPHARQARELAAALPIESALRWRTQASRCPTPCPRASSPSRTLLCSFLTIPTPTLNPNPSAPTPNLVPVSMLRRCVAVSAWCSATAGRSTHFRPFCE